MTLFELVKYLKTKLSNDGYKILIQRPNEKTTLTFPIIIVEPLEDSTGFKADNKRQYFKNRYSIQLFILAHNFSNTNNKDNNKLLDVINKTNGYIEFISSYNDVENNNIFQYTYRLTI